MLQQHSVQRVEEAMHKKGRTSYSDLRQYLKKNSDLYRLGPTIRIAPSNASDAKERERWLLTDTEEAWMIAARFPVLCRQTFENQKSHWVLLNREQYVGARFGNDVPVRAKVIVVYDPHYGTKMLLGVWKRTIPQSRLTSFAEIRRKQ